MSFDSAARCVPSLAEFCGECWETGLSGRSGVTRREGGLAVLASKLQLQTTAQLGQNYRNSSSSDCFEINEALFFSIFNLRTFHFGSKECIAMHKPCIGDTGSAFCSAMRGHKDLKVCDTKMIIHVSLSLSLCCIIYI